MYTPQRTRSRRAGWARDAAACLAGARVVTKPVLIAAADNVWNGGANVSVGGATAGTLALLAGRARYTVACPTSAWVGSSSVLVAAADNVRRRWRWCGSGRCEQGIHRVRWRPTLRPCAENGALMAGVMKHAATATRTACSIIVEHGAFTYTFARRASQNLALGCWL